MPAKTVRKLNLIGGGSVGVVLPIEWLRFHKLRPSDQVEVLINHVVIVIPPDMPPNKKTRLEETISKLWRD